MKRDVNRGAFVKEYFKALAADAEIENADLDAAIDALGENPTTAEIDAIYTLLAGGAPADKWDGKVLTFTNVQQNSTEYVLYVDESNVFSIATTSADAVGEAAQFTCKKEASGKYSFFNEKAQLYMIWRAGKNYGYNNNAGTLDTYNATYCDWSINPSINIEDAYYIVSKRSNGTTDGAIIIMAAGTFDAWGNSEGYSGNYSNLFRIDVIDSETGIGEIKGENGKVNAIYDLQGRKVDSPTKGIYIINGKKALIK